MIYLEAVIFGLIGGTITSTLLLIPRMIDMYFDYKWDKYVKELSKKYH